MWRNNKRRDRKVGKFTFKWLGRHVVSDITKKGFVTLKNKNDKELKKMYNEARLKHFFRDSDGINKHQDFPEDEIDPSGDDCIENPINDIIQNN